jgi:hypothetical protein
MLRRSDLISDTPLQETFVSLMEHKQVRIIMYIERTPFDMLLEINAANAKRIVAELRAGTFRGVGLLVANNAQTSVCAADTEDREFVSRAVADMNAGLTSFDKKPGAKPEIQIRSPDDAFLAFNEARCGFMFGDGALLKTFLEALERDGYQAQIAPVVLPRDRADALLASLQAERKAAADQVVKEREAEARRIAELQQQRSQQETAEEQQRKLDKVRQQNDEAARREELERIRSLVASRGQTIVDGFQQRIRNHVASVVQEVAETKRRARLGLVLTEQEQKSQQAQYAAARMEDTFPQWSVALSTRVREEWEFGDIRATLEDYGQAHWRSRQIEAVAVRVEFPMSNKLIGERRTGCLVFVWVNDEEFMSMRQAASFACEEYEQRFSGWAKANAFASQWKLSPE